MSSIADIRKDYRLAVLDERHTGTDPFLFFNKWFDEAQASQIEDVNAMTLATADYNGIPHARIVLLKGVDEGFVFYTNYESAKAKEMSSCNYAALVFFWKELERQVRVEGTIEKTEPEESDEYFNSRPYGSKLGAWASPQSQTISDRKDLENKLEKLQQQFNDSNIRRPENWGGYRLIPNMIEFWQGRPDRLHDRIIFKKEGRTWAKYRLAP